MLARLLQTARRERKLPDSPAHSGRYGIGNSRRNDRHRGLTNARGRAVTSEKMHLYLGRFRKSQDLCVVKIVLLATPVSKCDLAFQRRTQAIQNTSF